MSYGVYLAHIIVLGVVHAHLAPMIGNAYLRIPVIAVVTFVITYLGVKVISLIRGVSMLLAEAVLVDLQARGFPVSFRKIRDSAE